MSHTPGPWLVSKHGTPDYAPQFGVYSEDHPADLAIVRDSEANARLIAAAPELLAALEEIAERGPVNGYKSVGALTLRLVETQSIARAAIKKARGE